MSSLLESELISDKAPSVSGDSDASSLDGEDNLAQEDDVLAKKARLEELKKELEATPYQYQQQSEMIKLYRELELYDDLEKSRRAMKELFPLDQTLWFEWINDEINMASSEEEYNKIISLFEAAVEDYLAIPIWERYVNFLIERFAEGLALDLVREKMNKAIRETQYHYGGGHAIWVKVLQFEEHLLECTSSESQIKRMLELYSAHILIPHNEIETTFSEFSSFVSTHLPQNEYEGIMKAANANYSESLAVSLELGPYEDYLNTYSFSWDAYYVYIKFLKSKLNSAKNKSTWIHYIMTAYERAITHHPTTPDIWTTYQMFLLKHFPESSTFPLVAVRGMLNCPWSSALIVFYLRSMEAGGINSLEAAFDKVMHRKFIQSNVEDLALILLERCSISQRLLDFCIPEELASLRAILRSCVDVLHSFHPTGDLHFRVLRYWANLEAYRIKDIEAARKVWKEVIQRYKNRASAWLQYFQFEAQFGTLDKARALLSRAYRALTDDPGSILVAWEDFDRLHGNLNSNQLTTSEIYSAQLQQIARENVAATSTAATNAEIQAKKERMRIKDRANKLRIRNKRKRTSEPNATCQNNSDVESEKGTSKNSHSRDSAQPGATLFVCNYAPEVDCDRLRTLFEKYGQVKEVRIPNLTVGETRNFAYIEFSTPEEAKNALELDGHVMDRELALSVKISDPSKRKFRNLSEKLVPSAKRLYISNIPPALAQNSSLLALFNPYGTIEFLRVFTENASGLPTGNAIVEFTQEESGYAALALNSTLIEGNVLGVSIADPRVVEKRTHKKSKKVYSSAPSKSETPGQILFVPRQNAKNRPHNRLDVKTAAPASLDQGNQPPKSNQDFRNLLLGKK